jgi:hypothetical protein
MKATNQNHQDIRKYYEGTFILVPEATEKVLYVEKVDINYIYVRTCEGEQGGIELTEKGYTIKDVLPHKQFYQPSPGTAMHIQRKPARMWKKGVHVENTTMCVVQENGGFSNAALTHFALETFHQTKGKFDSFSDLPQEFKSVAISPRMCLLKNGNILLDSFCVGMFNPKKKIAIIMKEVMNCLPQNLWEIKPV